MFNQIVTTTASLAPTTTSESVRNIVVFAGFPANALTLLRRFVKIKLHSHWLCQAKNNVILKDKWHDYGIWKIRLQITIFLVGIAEYENMILGGDKRKYRYFK
jgi:ATP-dependent protease HslVU (ClpYQ) peptidase subunit